MKIEEKIELFQKELDYIKNDRVRNAVTQILGDLPDYFFSVAASSTGKYHPAMSLGKGGLVRHTKAAVKIAMDLMQLEMFLPMKEDFDYIIGCLILHDGLKHGFDEERYTRADHPVLISEFIQSYRKDSQDTDEICRNIVLDRLSNGVLTHMGQWNTDYRTKKAIMPKPETKFQNFVHLCDYMASRKYIEMEF